jgi:hypothetical protein
MKKLLLALVFLVVGKVATAQDTLLFEDFNNVINFTYQVAPPSGQVYDSSGYNFDGDGLIDANDRDLEWFLILPFAIQDSLTIDGDTNVALASSSWFDPAGQALNYFILPSVQLNDASGVLTWKSAPRQTPLYCDGYKVLVSTTDNFENNFTDTLFVAGEYLSRVDPLPDSSFAGFTFSEGEVHGLDGTYIEYGGDSIRMLGVLKPHSVSLAQYAGQKIYIAFLHDADDDNLISIDDICLRGDGTVNLDETKADIEVGMFPNPATSTVNLNFNVVKSGPVSLEVYDLSGKQLEKRAIGARLKGQHTYQFDVAGYAAGNYLVTLRTLGGAKTLNLSVVK